MSSFIIRKGFKSTLAAATDRRKIPFIFRRYEIFSKIKYFFKKGIDKSVFLCYNIKALNGSLAQLGEHLPYKQRVTGSSPVLSTKKIQMAL